MDVEECHACLWYQNFPNFFCKFLVIVRIVTFVDSQSNEVLPVPDQLDHSIVQQNTIPPRNNFQGNNKSMAHNDFQWLPFQWLQHSYATFFAFLTLMLQSDWSGTGSTSLLWLPTNVTILTITKNLQKKIN